MDCVELFYTEQDDGCIDTYHMLSSLVEKRSLLFIAYDVDTTEGMTKAIERKVQGVPLIVINNKKVIKGTPFSEKQILDNMDSE